MEREDEDGVAGGAPGRWERTDKRRNQPLSLSPVKYLMTLNGLRREQFKETDLLEEVK